MKSEKSIWIWLYIWGKFSSMVSKDWPNWNVHMYLYFVVSMSFFKYFRYIIRNIGIFIQMVAKLVLANIFFILLWVDSIFCEHFLYTLYNIQIFSSFKWFNMCCISSAIFNLIQGRYIWIIFIGLKCLSMFVFRRKHLIEIREIHLNLIVHLGKV